MSDLVWSGLGIVAFAAIAAGARWVGTRLATKRVLDLPCTDFPDGTGTCRTNDGTGLWCDNCLRSART